MRQRKSKINLMDYENDYCTVIEPDPNDSCKWLVRCKKCGEIHSQRPRSIVANGHTRSCKEYHVWNYSGLDRWDCMIRRVYGITYQEYLDKLEEQNNGCAICGKTIDRESRRLAIDHDHETGTVRGILCSTCNMGLGMFNDNKELLVNAIEYLEKTKGETIT